MRKDGPPPKLLLVEDDADIAAGIADYLGVHGVEVDFAYTAAQARSRLQVQAFDLVVLDVNLPDQDGLSLCRMLKREADLRSPVPISSTCRALGAEVRAVEEGGGARRVP